MEGYDVLPKHRLTMKKRDGWIKLNISTFLKLYMTKITHIPQYR